MNTQNTPIPPQDRASSEAVPSAHTPGPWSVLTEPRWPFGLSIASAGGSVVVEQNRMAYSSEQKTLLQVMHGDWMGKDQREAARVNALQMANLRLIAAAPDFYVGAQHLMDYEAAIEAGDHISAMQHYADAVDTLRAAIAKATSNTDSATGSPTGDNS